MEDESGGVIPQNVRTLGIQERELVSTFVITSSISKVSAMSIDASTQAQWTEGGAREEDLRQGGSTTVEGHETEEERPVEMSITTQGTNEKTATGSKDEPTVETQKTNGSSDTGSERSSGLDDNDLFKSAHEDYVTVVDADLKVDLEEQIPLAFESSGGSDDKVGVLLGEISQTPTLTSSETQIFDQSTQTDDLEGEASTSICESSPETASQLVHLEEQLTKTLEASTASRDKLLESHRLLKDLLCKELPILKDAHCRNKELVVTWLVETKRDMENALSTLKVREEERSRQVNSIMQGEREELEEIQRQITRKCDEERKEFQEIRTKLECEKKSLLDDLKKLQIEKEGNESQHRSETERLSGIIQEYRSKYEAQQSTSQKLQEHKSRSEEDQQIRFNSIITKLKREKEQAVGQTLEKLKAVELQLEQQRERAQLAIEEKETLAQVKGDDGIKFQNREQELVASLKAAGAELQVAEKTLREKEQNFQQGLEEEKAKALLLLEVERQMWEAEKVRQDGQKIEETEYAL